MLIIFAVQSYETVSNQPVTEAIWKNWDARHYLQIAQTGYTATGEHRFLIVYFPLYPALIALFNFVFGNYVISALVVSGIASVFAAVLLYELVNLDFPEKIAESSVFFLFIFPTSYFLHIAYPESLFLVLCLGSFLAARKRSWIICGFLGMLASLTKINAAFLFPALLFEIWNEYRETKKFRKEWLALSFIPLGFLIYLWLNFYVTGHAWMFVVHQRNNWQKYLRVPWESLWETAKSMLQTEPNVWLVRGFQEMFFVTIGFVSIVFGWKYFRNSYRVWMILNWLIFVGTSFILSVPRYTLMLFPVFILMASAAERNRYVKLIFVLWSILYLALFSTQYVRGSWAF